MTVLATHSLVRRRGERTVLDGIEVTFAGGQLSAIVGPNGAGKTTLLRLLAGLDLPDGGEAVLDGSRIDRLDAAVRSRRIAYLPQSAAVYWPLLGRDLVALGRLPHGADLSRPLSPTDTAAIERALARVGGAPLAARRIDELSQGSDTFFFPVPLLVQFHTSTGWRRTEELASDVISIAYECFDTLSPRELPCRTCLSDSWGLPARRSSYVFGAV